jgi:hypothetical protein
MKKPFVAFMMIVGVPAIPARGRPTMFSTQGSTEKSRLEVIVLKRQRAPDLPKKEQHELQVQGVVDVAKAEKQAVETAKRFVSAMKAKDLAAAMKVADAPWWQDERLVIHKRADLEKHLKQQFKALAPLGKLKFEVISSIEWFRLRKILTETEVKQGDGVFMSKDFLVFVGGRAKEETGSLIIRIRGTKGAVVGAKTLGGL